MKNNFQKILNEKRNITRLIVFLIFDTILISISVYLAFIVRFEGQIPNQYFLNIYGVILSTLIITIPIFYFSKLYYFDWDYVSTEELISLTKATSLSFLILTAALFILRDQTIFTGFPRSTLFISYFFIFIFCGGTRFAKRVYLQTFSSRGKEKKERTLIAGAGDAGEQILRSILNSKYSPYFPIGFVDDNIAKKGILIHGLKVLGKISDISRIAKEKKVESLIIAIPSAGSQIIKKAAEEGLKAGLKKIEEFSSVGTLRKIEMEDLLERKPVVLDRVLIEEFIKGKRILVTGAAGSIGSELCRQVAEFKPSSLLVLDQDETGIFNISGEIKNKFPNLKVVSLIADIQDGAKIDRTFNELKPNLVFHAAAYKHVPLMEEHPEEAVKNNIFGTKTVAENTLKYGVEKFIFISTDKAVNPISIMGTTKRTGEMLCQTLNQKNHTKFISVRFGNVLGSRGSVIPIFQEQINKGGPIKITNEKMKRYFMTTPEACLLVMEAGAMGKGGEVFVLDMGDPVKIIDLAEELIKRSGFKPEEEIRIEYTETRPGEKLSEELLTAEEGTIATQNQKIFMAKLSEINKEKLNSGLEKLKTAAYNGEKEIIKETLRELIPNYESK